MSKTFVFVGLPTVGNELVPNLLEAGYKAAPSVARADVVFTYTPFLDDTEEVYFGSEGMIVAAQPGACLVNLSAATPSLSKEVSALAQVSNLVAIEAPLFVYDVAREHPFADRSNVSAFVGTDSAALGDIEPMLSALAGNLVYCEGEGNGQLVKSISTLQRAASVLGLVESDALCRMTQGFSNSSTPLVVNQALGVGAVGKDIQSLYEAIVSKQFGSSYTTQVLLGEVVAALSAADDANLILPQAESAEYLLQLLATIGGAEKGLSSLALLYAEETECERYGLDWSRANEFYGSMDGYEYDHADDYEGYDDEDEHGAAGHHHHHHRPGEHGFDFGSYSSN